jgi:hypothetical protein
MFRVSTGSSGEPSALRVVVAENVFTGAPRESPGIRISHITGTGLDAGHQFVVISSELFSFAGKESRHGDQQLNDNGPWKMFLEPPKVPWTRHVGRATERKSAIGAGCAQFGQPVFHGDIGGRDNPDIARALGNCISNKGIQARGRLGAGPCLNSVIHFFTLF